MSGVETYKKDLRERVFELNQIPNPLCITLTPNRKLSEEKLREERKFFENKLNYKVHKNSYRRFNKKLRMFCVQEYDKKLLLHIHGIIEKPENLTLENFRNLISEIWCNQIESGLNIKLVEPDNELEFQGRTGIDGWFNYCLKDLDNGQSPSQVDTV